MMTTDIETELQRMGTSSTPASIGLVAQLSAVIIKAMREKLAARDQRIAALESRLDSVQRQLSEATRAIAATRGQTQ
jgi:BMFP domain-containing protein YqiC